MTVATFVSARRSDLVALVGLVVCGAVAVATLPFVSNSPYGDWAPIVIGPVIVAITVPVLFRLAEGEERLVLWILLAGLGLKFVGAVLRHHFAFEVYGGSADAAGYHGHGTRIIEGIRAGVLPEIAGTEGTDALRLITAFVYLFTGSTLLGGFLVFAWISFWGQVLAWRAFRIAVPDGSSVRYAALVFLFPTMWFWPSSTGKDAWMVGVLGLATYAAARLLAVDRPMGGLGLLVVALGLGAWVRPHMAALMAAALAFAVLARRGSTTPGAPASRYRVIAVIAVGVALLLVARLAQDQFARAYGSTDVAEVLEATAERTSKDGSSYGPAVVTSPVDLPRAAFTVLFRPHLLEAHNLQALVVAGEATLLLGVTLLSRRRIVNALRSLRRKPHLALAAMYTGLFVVAFSSIGNFGILARQRSQLLPLYAVVLAAPLAVRHTLPQDRE